MKIAIALTALTLLASGGEPIVPPPPPGPPAPTPPVVNTPPAQRVAQPPAPPRMAQAPMTMVRPPNQDFVTALERLRTQPRAGELSNGTFSSPVADVFTDSPDTKMKVTAVMAEYEKAMVEQAKKWEKELSDLRAQYDAKIVAELPEARREIAKTLVDTSRQKWSESKARDTATRAEFMERMRNDARTPATRTPGPNGVPPVPGQPNSAAKEWLTEENAKNARQDEAVVKALRDMLAPDEAARFDRRVRTRPTLPSSNPGLGVRPNGPAVPPAPPAPAATNLPPAPVLPPAPPAPNTEKK